MPRQHLPPQAPSLNPSPVTAIFFLCIFVLTVVLVLMWRSLPTPPRAPEPQPARVEQPVLKTEAGLTQGSCEAGGGKWTDCASPCLGKKDEACIQLCVPQCLCGGKAAWSCPNDFTCTVTSTSEIGSCALPAPVATSTAVIRERPAGMLCDAENFICMSETYLNRALESPFVVTGTVLAFEGQFVWELNDASGNHLEGGTAMSSASDTGMTGSFEIRSFLLTLPKTASGTLVLFESSPKDGTPIHELRIPVGLPTKTREIKTFLLRLAEDDTVGIGCEEGKFFSFNIPHTSLPVEASLRFLMDPRIFPDGYESKIPHTATLRSLDFRDGSLRLEFSEELAERAMGAYRSCGIRAQIERTVKQFPSVKQVMISVEGEAVENR